MKRNLTRAGTRSRYAPVKAERDPSVIIYSIILFLMFFFATVVGGGIAMKMGWIDGLGPLIELLKPMQA